MGIHRARFALAMIAFVGLAGCQSSGNNNQAFWKTNPFASKTASTTSKPELPAKPSSQVANPAGTNAPTSGGLAARQTPTGSGLPSRSSTMPSSPAYPGQATSFNSPSGMAGSAAPGYGTPGGTASNVDPAVSPQRGYYSAPASSAGTRSAVGGVNAPSTGAYGATDAASRYNSTSPSAGFRSGAKDYTAPSTDYASPGNSAANRGGVTIPRYNASADRYGTSPASPTSPDRSTAGTDRYGAGTDRYGTNPAAAGMDRYNSAPRTGAAYDPITAARGNTPSPYGPTASAANAASAGARTGLSDPFQSGSRSASPSTAGQGAPDRSPAVYTNPYANADAPRSPNATNDRLGTPGYRDVPATGPSPSGRTNSNTGAGNFAPASPGPGAPNGDYRSTPNNYAPASGDYRSNNTGNAPAANDYRQGPAGYNSPSASNRAPNGYASPSNVAADEPAPFRPGSTSDFVPRSANPGPAVSSARADLPGARVDTSVRPSGYSTGAADYTR